MDEKSDIYIYIYNKMEVNFCRAERLLILYLSQYATCVFLTKGFFPSFFLVFFPIFIRKEIYIKKEAPWANEKCEKLVFLNQTASS